MASAVVAYRTIPLPLAPPADQGVWGPVLEVCVKPLTSQKTTYFLVAKNSAILLGCICISPF